MGVAAWQGRALDAALRDPNCFERFSVLADAPLLAVDVRAPLALSKPARARLALLPCVTVGVGVRAFGGAAHAANEDAAQCDLVLETEREVRALQGTVARRPLASLALVQLLRRGAALTLEQAVQDESLAYATLQAGPEFAAFLRRKKGEARARGRAQASRAPVLRVRREGALLRLQLHRPERRNALNVALRDALCEALSLALRDASVQRVELSGAGADFCSGGDLDEFGTLQNPAHAHAIRSTRSAALLLAACADARPRVTARVHGACMGAGVELPAFCSHVRARKGAFFALPELELGLIPGAGGTASLPRRIGRQRTAWMALTCARVDAKTAHAWGLVDAIEEEP